MSHPADGKWFAVGAKMRAVSPAGRGLQYGDGLFETIAIRSGEPRLWRYHLERLSAGCARLGLVAPGPALAQELERALLQCALDTSRCIAKIVVTAAATGRGYGRAMPSPAEVLIGIFPATPADGQDYLDGVSTMLCDTRLASGSPVAGIKTLGRIEQVLARSECLQAGVFEGFTRDADDRLICGTISNMFVVKDTVVRTPSLARCGVEGTMRRLVLELLAEDTRRVEVCDLTEDDLATADEVFITNSQFGALPVRSCGDYAWPVGATTRHVMGLLADYGIEECRQ